MTNTNEDLNSEAFLKRLRFYFLILIVFVGISQAWATKDSMYADGISYLDVGDAYFKGDFKSAINANGYWSPLYCLIQGFAYYIFNPSIDFHSLFVRLVNFVLYILAFLAFNFFFNELLKKIDNEKNELITFPKWAWISIGYLLFLWSSTNLIGLSMITPDMCVSGFIYLISGLILRIEQNKSNLFTYILIGLFLGLNFLTKAAMFPLGFIYLFTIFFIKRNFLNTFIALIVFLAVSTPYIYELSKAKGHLTFSEVGKLNHSYRMNDTYNCWMEGLKGCEQVIHPAKRIFTEPNVYEFSKPISGSYPIWFDPTYWFDGLHAKFSLEKQLKILSKSFREYINLFLEMQGFLIAGFLILFINSNQKIKDIFRAWYFIIPSVCIIMTYTLISIEYRLVGGFIVLIWFSLFSSIKLPNTKESKKLLESVSIVLIIFLLITSSASKDLITNGRISSCEMHRAVAKHLLQLGLKEKDQIAVIGTDYGIYYARLAKVKIISELPIEEEKIFWASNADIKEEIFTKLRNLNAKFIISEKAPSNASKQGWKNIENTPYYYHDLNN